MAYGQASLIRVAKPANERQALLILSPVHTTAASGPARTQSLQHNAIADLIAMESQRGRTSPRGAARGRATLQDKCAVRSKSAYASGSLLSKMECFANGRKCTWTGNVRF